MAEELDPEIIRKLNQGLQLTDEEMQRLAKDATLAGKAMATLTTTMRALGTGVADYSKRITAGEKGASAFNTAISGTTGAMGDLLMKMGPLGKAMGLLVKGIGGYVTAVNALSDRLYKSYSDLSKVGLTAEDGMTGLADAARRLGYGIDEVGIENFGRQMVKASEDLALMSGSALRGRKAFVDFASQISRGPVQRAFMNLGYSVEDLNEMSANYVQQQVNMGRASIKTERELVAETQEYIKLLDLQSKLTGQSVASLQERMDADLRNERFQAYVMKVEREQGREAADILRVNMAAVSKQFPGIADGLKDIAAGYPTTKAAQAVFMSGMANIPKEMHKYVGAGFDELGNASRKLTSRYGEQFGAVGIFGEVFVPLNEAVKAGNLAERDRIALLEEAQRIQKEQLDGGADGVDAATKLRISQMNTRDSMQNLLLIGVNPLTSAMSGLSSVVEYLTKGLESVLGIFGYKAPTRPGAPGAPGAAGAAPGTKPGGMMGAAAKNLNPGNLRFAGQAGATLGTGGFAKFQTVDDGLVALARQLDMYLTGKSAMGKRDTIASIISAYAPPNENETKTYIDQMASFMGKRPDEVLSRDPATLAKLMVGIIGKESMGGLEKGYNMRGGIQYAVAQIMGIDPSKVGQFYRGGIADRLSFVGEAGAEAVVPLPGNRKIPVMLNVDNLAQKLASSMENMASARGGGFGSMLNIDNLAQRLLGSMDNMAAGRGPMGGLSTMLMNMFRDMDTARAATAAPTAPVTSRGTDMNETLSQLVSIFQSSNMALADLVSLQRQANRNSERLLQAQT